jgi:hypothetical protein
LHNRIQASEHSKLKLKGLRHSYSGGVPHSKIAPFAILEWGF